MAQPAIKKDQVPANDADYQHSLEAMALQVENGQKEHAQTENGQSENGQAKTGDGTSDESNTYNPVKQAVDEFKALVDEMDDIREILRAHGVPLRTTRLIVELGVQDKPDKQALAINGAMEQVVETMGEGCLERDVLENHIAAIVTLEHDLTHARSTAREAGLDPQALVKLTQMVQQNPGDGGAKAVSTLFGYAVAYGIKTDQLAEIVADVTQRPASVLPQIQRKTGSAQKPASRKFGQDLLVGLFIGVIVIYMLI